MDNQHISSYENGDRPRAMETHDSTPRRRDTKIHHPHSHKASGRGKSLQWKPKSNDNRSYISPNSPENRASTPNSSSDLGFQSPYESKDTHMASNLTSTSRNSSTSPLYYDSNNAHMAGNLDSTSQNSSSSNLGLQPHVPRNSPLYYESKDTCMAKNRASTSQSQLLHPSPLYESKNTHISENRASTSQNVSSNLGFQSHPSHLHESNDTHSIGGIQINECCDEENCSPSSSKNSEEHAGLFFDICPPRNTNTFYLKPTLFAINREIRKENKHKPDNSKHVVLRRGMVLLKSYLTSDEQIKIIQRCRQMGKNKGGFYKPEYKDGAVLKLKMMCLGRNWEPERGYISKRSCDGANPPEIPLEFLQIVQNVIQKSQELVTLNPGCKKQDVPSMIPDICIVNFYSSGGKLGLHQDKSESKESISKGLPVVSFSVGDSGDFLYGDDPDENKAEKIVLESGDVLVFGGESRLVFHGVSAIKKISAPNSLSKETNIISGRLNLTFRKY